MDNKIKYDKNANNKLEKLIHAADFQGRFGLQSEYITIRMQRPDASVLNKLEELSKSRSYEYEVCNLEGGTCQEKSITINFSKLPLDAYDKLVDLLAEEITAGRRRRADKAKKVYLEKLAEIDASIDKEAKPALVAAGKPTFALQEIQDELAKDLGVNSKRTSAARG